MRAYTYEQLDQPNTASADERWTLSTAFMVAPADGAVQCHAKFYSVRDAQFADANAWLRSSYNTIRLEPKENLGFQNPATLEQHPPPFKVKKGEALLFVTWRSNVRARQESWEFYMEFTEGNVPGAVDPASRASSR